MKKYAIVSYEFSNFTDKELIRYNYEELNFHGNRTFRFVTTIIPHRNKLKNVFHEYYRPLGEIYRFEAEDDDAAKLIFEIGENLC